MTNLDAAVSVSDGQLSWKARNGDYDLSLRVLRKSELSGLEQQLRQLSYIHLWFPLRLLCNKIEDFINFINGFHSFGWGVTIILFSLLFKLFSLPVNFLQASYQRKSSLTQAALSQELTKIKKHFKGEEAHELYLDAHKKLGVTPFHSLKPLLVSFIPVPFWISIFNVLGELDSLNGRSFLWINDLSEPDMAIELSFSIPLFGNSVNLLPILMTYVTVLAAMRLKSSVVPHSELLKQRKKLYVMAVGFLLVSILSRHQWYFIGPSQIYGH